MKLYSKVIPHYSKDDASYSKAVKYIHEWIRNDERRCHLNKMLDLGCGFGAQAIALSKLGYNIVAVDRSLCMLSLFRKRMTDHKTYDNNLTIIEDDWNNKAPSWYKKGYYNIVYSLGNTIAMSGSLEDLRILFKIVQHVLCSDGLFFFDICYFSLVNIVGDILWLGKTNINDGVDYFERGFSKSLGNDGNTMDLILHVKWCIDNEMSYETEKYKLLIIDNKLIQDMCCEYNFSLIHCCDLDNDSYPSLNSNKAFFVLKKGVL